ncbi:MAG: glutaminyl-peptide cyclotransferase [Bacteroidales bacterium]|nr:glutaminyl-peptide cyclotransferase [Bacteroidales bacterium]
MKKYLLFFLLIFPFIACTEKGKMFSVTSPQKKLLYSGDSVSFDLVSKKKLVPDSVVITVDGKMFPFYKKNHCTLSTENISMGDKTVTFHTFYKGKKETSLRSLRILSDIVPAHLKYEVVAAYNHDKNSYTQGLQYEDGGKFYESAGLYNESSLRLVEVETGKVLRKHIVDSNYFAEGLTIVGDTLFQLTWRERTGFMYNKNTFEEIGTFTYETEGWGICYDGTYLIVSDGSEYLYFYEPHTMNLHHKIAVFDNLGAVTNINELEFVQGFVYANIYTSYRVVKINPTNGKVAADVDFSNLLPLQYSDEVDVLNGIAWNPKNEHFYITGKLWPRLFQVKLFFEE